MRVKRGTAYEFSLDGLMDRNTDYKCSICGEKIKTYNRKYDEWNDDEELYECDGKIYHAECINFNIAEMGARYIRTECMQDYAEWYLNCMFYDFSYEEWLCDPMLEDTARVVDYIEDNIECFFDWFERSDDNEC